MFCCFIPNNGILLTDIGDMYCGHKQMFANCCRTMCLSPFEGRMRVWMLAVRVDILAFCDVFTLRVLAGR